MLQMLIYTWLCQQQKNLSVEIIAEAFSLELAMIRVLLKELHRKGYVIESKCGEYVVCDYNLSFKDSH